LYVGEQPICLECDERREEYQRNGNHPQEHRRVSQLLEEEVRIAQSRLTQAHAEFHSVMSQTPSGLPPSDGTQRIRNASRECSHARETLMAAIRRLNSFTIYGAIPEDLKK